MVIPPRLLSAAEIRRDVATMLRKIVVLSAMATGLSALQAAAAAAPSGEPALPRVQADRNLLQLAQSEVEVFYDSRGNRVLVDPYTGKVIAVQPPETRLNRPALRREMRRQELRRDYRQGDVLIGPADDGYYSDDALAVPADPNGDDYYNNDLDAFPEAPGGPRVVSREPLQSPDDQPALPANPRITDRPLEPSIAVKGREDVASLQILLDRLGASPGVIDGRFGSNVDKALVAYNEMTGASLKSTDAEGIKQALAETGGDAFGSYTITPEDAAGPFVASVPADYSEKAKLERMAFTSVTEMLAERFHMDENYLKALNPDLNFNRPGTIVKVANFGKLVNKPVSRIVADKGLKQVRAYNEAGQLVAAYPATIGSGDTPSPTGTHAVSRVALDPNYTYNPKLNFKQGENDKVLTIPPGPNGPVGSVWIALDKPTYGIHGTPDPSKIGKTESHGCVRLTNWDARELAKIVKAGVPVEFME
ncbi:lipoprotein-anchoring transpeptidase ErfK/SrfK [Aminobacter aminovorans]|uniref:L,D-transpeptidase YkuD n=2 Tax=Aminobacter aminovorans TaxID=83263 RepID=A0A380WHZ3_AMIAI|nr:lipoprotein-anchoring transpeptidase ErfK/SrfK [Aminobacter aminovorans]SUU88395.1 Putative L,D-transpeptidase YkuD [Aminobacter aminovorans]